MKKLINVNVLLFLASTLISLLFAEFIVRFHLPEYNRWNYNVLHLDDGFNSTAIPNALNQYTNSRNEFNFECKINSYGFRDNEDLKLSRDSDITILGDSFCFGFGVEEKDRFGNVFKILIKEEDVNVFNLGISNCHFLNYQANLKYAQKLGLKSKKMILGVCMENDFLDYQNIQYPNSSKWLGIKDWFHKKSSLYAFVGSKIHSNKIIENLLFSLGISNKLQPTQLPIYFQTDSLITQSIDLIKEITSDFETVVLIIPSRYLWVDEHKEKTNEVREKFIQQLRKESIPYLDIKPIFEAKSDNPLKEFYYDYDGHWNVEGNRIVGETIRDSFQIMKQ